jgi:hypothetical protein
LRDGDRADARMLDIIDRFHGPGLSMIEKIAVRLHRRIHDAGRR